MGKRKACPHCGGFNLHSWALGKVKCKGCHKAFGRHDIVSLEYVPKKRRKNTRRVADRQEKRVAKKLGARQTIASGQTPIDKADVKSEMLRAECKYTSKQSYILKRADLNLIAGQAGAEQIPVFVLEFQKAPSESFYVIPEDWFVQLLESYVNERNSDDQ
jgi:hypothetical protein